MSTHLCLSTFTAHLINACEMWHWVWHWRCVQPRSAYPGICVSSTRKKSFSLLSSYLNWEHVGLDWSLPACLHEGRAWLKRNQSRGGRNNENSFVSWIKLHLKLPHGSLCYLTFMFSHLEVSAATYNWKSPKWRTWSIKHGAVTPTETVFQYLIFNAARQKFPQVHY